MTIMQVDLRNPICNFNDYHHNLNPMSTEFSRRDALRLLGLSAGASILPVSLFAKNEQGQPILLPENNGYQKLR
jgi:hypothetical protein